MKFRKKPVVIEAVQFDGVRQIAGVIISPVLEPTDANPSGVYGQIKTLEGVMTCIPGDWIITGIKGEVYPCKPDIFEATYERVREVTHYPDGMGEESRRLHREYNALVKAQEAGSRNDAEVRKLTDECNAAALPAPRPPADVRFELHLTRLERASYEHRAAQAGLSVSEWIRRMLAERKEE